MWFFGAIVQNLCILGSMSYIFPWSGFLITIKTLFKGVILSKAIGGKRALHELPAYLHLIVQLDPDEYELGVWGRRRPNV